MEKNLKNETEICCKCGEFVLCKDCYCKIPEILFLHEENCEGKLFINNSLNQYQITYFI